MAVTIGTNSGFVLTEPTADPAGNTTTLDGNAIVAKDTSPSNAARVTKVGWWRDSGTDTSNFELGLYSDSGGVADVRLFVEATNSSSATGWITRTVNWTISPSTAYWLAIQMDAHTGSSLIDREITGGNGFDVVGGGGTLPNPFGGGGVVQPSGKVAIWALVEPLFVPAWGGRATSIIGGAF
jgi:hypothetical protein